MDKNLYEFTERIHYTKPDDSTDRPVLAIISGTNYSLMVDGGASPDHTTNFLHRIQEHRLDTPSFCVLTHWHWDHSFGASVLDCPLIAHPVAAKELLVQKTFSWDNISISERVAEGIEIPMIQKHLVVEYPDENREITVRIPDLLFTDSMEFDLGEIHCVLKHVGGDHSADSVIVYVPEEKIVFLGDCTFYNLHSPSPVYRPQNVIPLFEYLIGLDAEYYFFSHDDYPTPRASFLEYSAVIMNLAKASESLVGTRTLESLLSAYSNLANSSLPEEDWDLADAFLNE